MTDERRPDAPTPKPIDESTYCGSAAETGGLYDDGGATIANPEGDTMAVDDFEDQPGPGADPGEAYGRAVAAGEATPYDERADETDSPVDEVFRSGS
jgi:hypothetical protein